MLHYLLVKNWAFLDYKKSLFGQVAMLEFFQRGDPMNLVQIKKLLLGRLLDKLRLEIMLHHYLVTNLAFLAYKKSQFGQVAILEFFQRGDPMNLVQN